MTPARLPNCSIHQPDPVEGRVDSKLEQCRSTSITFPVLYHVAMMLASRCAECELHARWAHASAARDSNESTAGLPFRYSSYSPADGWMEGWMINFLLLLRSDPVHFRPRVCSLPEKPYNPRSRDDIYRLRNFSITSKGVVNRGDALISRHSRSNTSINSTLTA